MLAGLAVVALTLAGASAAVYRTMEARLVDQIDEQLEAIARSGGGIPDTLRNRRGLGNPRERFSVVYEGLLLTDGTAVTIFAPNTPGRDFSPPAVALDDIERTWRPFTVDAEDGDSRYRVLATDSPFADVAYTINAVPLDDVDDAVSRLFGFQSLTFLVVVAALGAVAWWVIRLGIRPVKAMTDAAGLIAEGDLSHRVPEPREANTESGRLARALNTMLGRIQTEVDARTRSEERLRTFVADASHELRTPLTTIRGYTELYAHGGLSQPDDLDDAMRRTHQEAERMGRLVEDMLTLAKLDRERAEIATEVNMSALLDDAVTDLRVTAPDHSVTATIEPDLVVIGVDDRLRQVVTNLLRNSVVHTPPGTVIGVSGRRTDDRVLIQVSDNGPGMAPDVVERVTERFYRADRSRSRQSGGSGLGLAIVDAIVRSHDGELTIVSNVGSGTANSVSLPAHRASAPT